MTQPQNNLITFTPGSIIQSAQVNQDLNDIVQLGGNSAGSQLQTLLSANFNNFVQSGGIITTASGLTVNMQAAYIVVAGLTYYMPPQSLTLTASQDTYIDFIPGSIPVYHAAPLANNSTSPALYTANAVRMAIIISAASSITYINQGDPAASAPIVSGRTLGIVDTLGNIIYPNTAYPTTVGWSMYLATQTGVTTETSLTGLTTPVIAPGNRRVKIYFSLIVLNSVLADGIQVNIKEGSTILSQQITYSVGNSTSMTIAGFVEVLPTAGVHTYLLSMKPLTGGTAATSAGSTYPALLGVDFV
jgi:hypothetical protein